LTPSRPLSPIVYLSLVLLSQLSAAVTKGIGKPEAYVMCTVTLDQPMVFGGTEDPCAFADIHSIGSIGGEKNKQVCSLDTYEFFRLWDNVVCLPEAGSSGIEFVC